MTSFCRLCLLLLRATRCNELGIVLEVEGTPMRAEKYWRDLRISMNLISKPERISLWTLLGLLIISLLAFYLIAHGVIPIWFVFCPNEFE